MRAAWRKTAREDARLGVRRRTARRGLGRYVRTAWRQVARGARRGKAHSSAQVRAARAHGMARGGARSSAREATQLGTGLSGASGSALLLACRLLTGCGAAREARLGLELLAGRCSVRGSGARGGSGRGTQQGDAAAIESIGPQDG